MAQFGGAGEHGQSGLEGGLVAGPHEQARFPVEDDLRHRVVPRADRRQTCGGRFLVHQAEGLVPGGHHEDVRRRPAGAPRRRVRLDVAGDRHAGGKRHGHGPVGDQLELGTFVKAAGPPRVEQIGPPLAREVPPDEEEARFRPGPGARLPRLDPRAIEVRQQHGIRHDVHRRRAVRIHAAQRVRRPARRRDDGRGAAEHRPVELHVRTIRRALDRGRGVLLDALLRAVHRHDRRNPAHQVEAGVRGRLPVEVDDVEWLGPGGVDPPAGEQARVQLVPEARQVEVPDAERAVDPHALAERAAHGAIEQRQILGEDDVPPFDGGLVWEIFPEEVVEGGEPQDAAVDEQHADHYRNSQPPTEPLSALACLEREIRRSGVF